MNGCNRNYIVFGEEHYNPLGIIRSLGENGIYPVCIIIKAKAKISSQSKYIGELHYVNDIEEGYRLLIDNFSDGNEKSYIFTSDDKVTSFLDCHYEELKDKFYFFNAGESGRITHYMDKNNINQLAIKYGLNVARTWIVQKGEIPDDIEFPIITKAISSNSGAWKADVFICNNMDDLKEAYQKIVGTTILLQKYIKKKNELCLDGFACNKGKNVVYAIASNYNYILPDKYSSYMTFFNFTDIDLKNKLDAMFDEVQFEGIFSVEFLLGEDGKYYFLEINFRNSTWSYASTKLGMNLPLLWSQSMINPSIAKSCEKKIPDGYTAMVELSDFKTRVLGRKVSLIKWISELKNADCLFLYNKNDKKPFFSSLFSKL